jgi:hypothetical protein
MDDYRCWNKYGEEGHSEAEMRDSHMEREVHIRDRISQSSDTQTSYDATGQNKNIYYGQIQEIWALDFHGFTIPLFRCNWVDAIKDVIKDKYGFISIDLNRQGYKSQPFMLEKHVSLVFYIPDTTNKRLKVVIPKKRWIIRVENAIDEEEFDQFNDIPPFITSMIKPRIPSANEALYLHNNHHEKV